MQLQYHELLTDQQIPQYQLILQGRKKINNHIATSKILFPFYSFFFYPHPIQPFTVQSGHTFLLNLLFLLVNAVP